MLRLLLLAALAEPGPAWPPSYLVPARRRLLGTGLGLAAAGIALELALAPSWAGWLEGLELLDAAPR